MLSAGFDESAPPQAREVIRHLRLREPEPLDELSHRELAFVTEDFEDPHPDRVAQAPEVLRDEVGLHRGGRQAERGGGRHQEFLILQSSHACDD